MELKLVYGIWTVFPVIMGLLFVHNPPYKNCGPTGNLQAHIYVPTYLHRACAYLSRVGYPGRYHDNLILMKVNSVRIGYSTFLYLYSYAESGGPAGDKGGGNSRAALAILRIRIGRPMLIHQSAAQAQ